jgi:hypothetical protein
MIFDWVFDGGVFLVVKATKKNLNTQKNKLISIIQSANIM